VDQIAQDPTDRRGRPTGSRTMGLTSRRTNCSGGWAEQGISSNPRVWCDFERWHASKFRDLQQNCRRGRGHHYGWRHRRYWTCFAIL